MSRSNDTRLETLGAELDAALEDAPARQDNVAGRRLYRATVAGTSGSDVIVELGPRVQGAIPLEEFDEPPEAGAELRVALRGQEDGLWLFSIQSARALAAWDEMEVGSLVKGTVVGLNKGGLELKIGSLPAFMPASQVALHHVEDLAAFAGESLVCEVLEIDRDRRRVVVSRRAVLEAEREAKREESLGAIVEGSVVRGRVTRLESFGAFVEIVPGIEGLLHVSNISHRRVEDPSTVLKVGQEVEAQILEISEGGRRIGLGTKQLEADPWDGLAQRMPPDSVVTGTVRRIADFGAFVEVQPGLDGLLHVSEMGPGRVHDPRELFSVGDEVAVRVLKIDPHARRLSLSRLDPRGAVLGSDEAAAGEEIDRVLDESAKSPIGTNLGALFKKALDSKR